MPSYTRVPSLPTSKSLPDTILTIKNMCVYYHRFSELLMTSYHRASASQASVPQKTRKATRYRIYGYAVSDSWLRDYGVAHGLCGPDDCLIEWGCAVIHDLRYELHLHPVCTVASNVNDDSDRAFAFPVAPLPFPGEPKKLTKERIERVRQGLGKPEEEEPAWHYVVG